MKAMILAAGRGERMRPLTDNTPKPLLKVRGKALIVWLIESLAAANIRDIVINHAHLGQAIEGALGDGSTWNVRIAYSPEREALETAGGIAKALPLLGNDPFIVVNGDIFCDYDFSRLETRTLGADLARLLLVPNPPQRPAGDFHLDNGRVSSSGESAGVRTFAGIGLYAPQLCSASPRGARAPLAPLLRGAMAAGRVGGELHAGAWHDVGTPERLRELDAGT